MPDSSSDSRHPHTAQQGATRRNNINSGPAVLNRFLRSRNDLSERQKGAVELLLRGLSDQDVAQQLAVDRGTIFRWRKSIPFARELDRQRKILWQQSAAQLQSMVQPALDILRKQLNCDDEKLRLRAAAVLLRFATPSRLAPGAAGAEKAANAEDCTNFQDVIDYIEAPMPGQPGAPEDLEERCEDEVDSK